MVASYAASIFHHILREARAVFKVTEIRLALLNSAGTFALNSCNFGSKGSPMFLQKSTKHLKHQILLIIFTHHLTTSVSRGVESDSVCWFSASSVLTDLCQMNAR